MLFRSQKEGIILVRVCGRCQNGRQETNSGPNVENTNVDLGEPTSFFDHEYLGCTQRECKISKDTVDTYRHLFETRMSAGGTENYFFRENWGKHFLMGMRGKRLRIGEQNDSTITSSRNSMYWRPSIQRRRNRTCWRIVKSVRTIFLKSLYLDRTGRPDISMVWKQACSCHHEMDESMSHKWIRTKLSCGKYSTTM